MWSLFKLWFIIIIAVQSEFTQFLLKHRIPKTSRFWNRLSFPPQLRKKTDLALLGPNE
jgi:hypothetical protein